MGPNFCSFEFVKGKSSKDVHPGCAIITVDDIDWLKDGQITHAVYVCSTEKLPAQIKEQQLSLLGVSEITNIIPGKESQVTVYSQDEMKGLEKTFNDAFHPSLVHFHFPESSIGNDGIKSLSITSSSESYKLPDFCHNQPNAGVVQEHDVV